MTMAEHGLLAQVYPSCSDMYGPAKVAPALHLRMALPQADIVPLQNQATDLSSVYLRRAVVGLGKGRVGLSRVARSGKTWFGCAWLPCDDDKALHKSIMVEM